MHPQLQHTGDENGGTPGRYRYARFGDANPGFVKPALPGKERSHPQIRNSSIHVQLQQTGDKKMIARVYTAPHGVETPTWGLQSQRHPGRITFRPRIISPSIRIQLRQTRDENGCSPGRCRPARCGIPNLTDCFLAWVCRASATGEEKVPFTDQKSFRTSTTRTNPGRKLLSPGSITPRTLWKPQAQ